ncbi:MAG: hypothetical protein QM820_04760 [Minicystis sp.]
MLGILGLIGLATAVLIPIAVIVFGAVLLLGSGTTANLGTLGAPVRYQRLADAARQASVATAGVQALAGAGAVVLGILALVGYSPMTLALVGLLVLGSAVLLSGAAVTGRMGAVMRR